MATAVIPTEDVRLVKGPPQGQWTLSDWENLPEDGNRYEIIDGMIYMSTAPSLFHQWIIQRLYRAVGLPAEDQGLAYVFLAPIGLIMPGCDPVQPDFVLVLAERKSILQDRRIRGVPDLIVEVISPGSFAYDTDVKLKAYANAAVPEYVVINPSERTLAHYLLLEPGQFDSPRLFHEGDAASFRCLPSITFEISGLFTGAPDTTL